jgi:hypothetical protein
MSQAHIAEIVDYVREDGDIVVSTESEAQEVVAAAAAQGFDFGSKPYPHGFLIMDLNSNIQVCFGSLRD